MPKMSREKKTVPPIFPHISASTPTNLPTFSLSSKCLSRFEFPNKRFPVSHWNLPQYVLSIDVKLGYESWSHLTYLYLGLLRPGGMGWPGEEEGNTCGYISVRGVYQKWLAVETSCLVQ